MTFRQSELSRAMQNATDAEVAAVNRVHANLTFNEQIYAMVKRLEADVRSLKERVAELEKPTPTS